MSKGRGWLPELVDPRDYTLQRNAPKIRVSTSRGEEIDLRKEKYFSPIEDQGELGSCTVHAAIGVQEYIQQVRHGTYTDGSRLFLYLMSRRLTFHVSDPKRKIGDTGSHIRDAFKAMAAFGVPPEWAWPYDPEMLDDEPPRFVYGLALAYQGLHYVSARNLYECQALLEHGFPVAFGFTTFPSIEDTPSNGLIPIPKPSERPDGGHAVVAVGQCDRGILIRNSWGTEWGEDGHGILPWWYFDQGLCDDYWALLDSEWVE